MQLSKYLGILIFVLIINYQVHSQLKVVKGKGIYQGTIKADFDNDGKKDWIKIYETQDNNFGEVYCTTLNKQKILSFKSTVGENVWATIVFDNQFSILDRICLRIPVLFEHNEDYEIGYSLTVKYSKELKDFVIDELFFDDGKSKTHIKKYAKPLSLIQVNDIKEDTFTKSVIEEWDNDHKGYIKVKRPKFLPFRG